MIYYCSLHLKCQILFNVVTLNLIGVLFPLQFHGLLVVQSSAETQSHLKGYVINGSSLFCSATGVLLDFHYIIGSQLLSFNLSTFTFSHSLLVNNVFICLLVSTKCNILEIGEIYSDNPKCYPFSHNNLC